jgi:hypothetical protein
MDMLAGSMKPTERELIAARDHDAMARFYDRQVAMVLPELLAARVNGELPGQASPLAEHLAGCPTCQAAAARLGQPEVMFPVGSAGGVTELRTEWLQLAGQTSAEGADPRSSDLADEVRHRDQPLATPIRDREPPTGDRVRRGGLVGAVKAVGRCARCAAPSITGRHG